MSNENTNAGTSPAEITEAQVVAFMQQKQADLRKATGIDYAILRLCVDAQTGEPQWRSYVDGGTWTDDAPASALAIAAQVEYIQIHSKAARAKEARERAAVLLEMAKKLEEEAAQ